jgi:hypothetical protein
MKDKEEFARIWLLFVVAFLLLIMGVRLGELGFATAHGVFGALAIVMTLAGTWRAIKLIRKTFRSIKEELKC